MLVRKLVIIFFQGIIDMSLPTILNSFTGPPNIDFLIMSVGYFINKCHITTLYTTNIVPCVSAPGLHNYVELENFFYV